MGRFALAKPHDLQSTSEKTGDTSTWGACQAHPDARTCGVLLGATGSIHVRLGNLEHPIGQLLPLFMSQLICPPLPTL